MVIQDYIPLDRPAAWRSALEGVRHSFGHTWENCYAMQLTTGLDTYLYSYRSGDVRVVCPVAEQEYAGHRHIIKPFGFNGFVSNGDCTGFQQSWREFVNEKGFVCSYLGFNPLFDCSRYFSREDIFQYNTVQVLDLAPPIEELWRGLSNNRKRQLRDWDAVESLLVFDKQVLTDFFLSNYVDFFDRKNAPSFYYFSPETLRFLFEQDNVFMVGAPTPQRVESVSVFTYTADAAEYLFNISLPGCNHHAVALMWSGILHLKSRQIPVLNLGGGSTEFKRRFGGRDLPLKSFKQIHAPEVYRSLCRSANVDPDDREGYFPAYQKR